MDTVNRLRLVLEGSQDDDTVKSWLARWVNWWGKPENRKLLVHIAATTMEAAGLGKISSTFDVRDGASAGDSWALLELKGMVSDMGTRVSLRLRVDPPNTAHMLAGGEGRGIMTGTVEVAKFSGSTVGGIGEHSIRQLEIPPGGFQEVASELSKRLESALDSVKLDIARDATEPAKEAFVKKWNRGAPTYERECLDALVASNPSWKLTAKDFRISTARSSERSGSVENGYLAKKGKIEVTVRFSWLSGEPSTWVVKVDSRSYDSCGFRIGLYKDGKYIDAASGQITFDKGGEPSMVNFKGEFWQTVKKMGGN